MRLARWNAARNEAQQAREHLRKTAELLDKPDEHALMALGAAADLVEHLGDRIVEQTRQDAIDHNEYGKAA